MAISKRKYYVDASDKKVRKGTPGAIERQSNVFTISFTNRAGKTVRHRGYADRRASLVLEARLIQNEERAAEGLSPIQEDPNATAPPRERMPGRPAAGAADPDLEDIKRRWPDLPADVRRTISQVVRLTLKHS